MSFKLGRSTLRDPDVYQMQGERLVVSGLVIPDRALTEAQNGSVADLVAGQILGLNDRANVSVISVTWAQQPGVDGWYELDGDTSVEWIDIGYERPSMFRWSATLRRLTGFAAAMHETSVTYVARSFDFTAVIDVGVLWHGIVSWPAAAFAGPAETSYPRKTANGDLMAWELSQYGVASGVTTSNLVRYLLYPADAFIGCARFEVLREGGDPAENNDWYAAQGRQPGAEAAGRWRLTNDLVRLTAYGRTDGDLEWSVWNGSAWVSTSIAGNHHSGSAHSRRNLAVLDGSYTPAPVTILRNDLDVVSISVPTDQADNSFSQVYSLRRGMLFVEAFITVPTAASTNRPGFRFDTTTACTAYTVLGETLGMYATSATSSCRPWMSSASDTVRDVTNGYMSIDTATTGGATAQFAIGWEVDYGDGTTNPRTLAQNQITHFLTATMQTTEVVIR